MAEFSFPFSTSPITSEIDWSRFINALGILDGVVADDPSATPLKVTANGTGTITITAAPDGAVVNGFFYRADANVTKTVPANATGSNRIDRIVLRCSQSANSCLVTYVTGGTSAPALLADRTDVFDLPLAQITVAAGASVALATNVVDQRYFRGRPVAVGNSTARRPWNRGQMLIEGTAADPIIYIGTGTGWKQIYPNSSTSWLTPGLGAGWTHHGSGTQNVQFTKMSWGEVKMRGVARATSARPGGDTLFILPTGYRPAATELFKMTSTDDDFATSAFHGRIAVNSAGAVTSTSEMPSGAYISLSPISFFGV